MPTSPLPHRIISDLLNKIEEKYLCLNNLRTRREDLLRVIDYTRYNLVSATINEGTVCSPSKQFFFYKKIKELALPKTIVEIGEDAFSYSAINTLILLSPKPPILLPYNDNAWKPTIIVPNALFEAYKNSFWWKRFSIKEMH